MDRTSGRFLALPLVGALILAASATWDAGSDCQGWTSADGVAHAGRTGFTGSTFDAFVGTGNAMGLAPCSAPRRLLCVEQPAP